MLIEKQELITEVQIFLEELKKNNPEKGSHEWYLINNLNNYLELLIITNTSTAIKSASEKLDMYCIDCMNWDTPLFKRCMKITRLGLKIAKNN